MRPVCTNMRADEVFTPVCTSAVLHIVTKSANLFPFPFPGHPTRPLSSTTMTQHDEDGYLSSPSCSYRMTMMTVLPPWRDGVNG